MIIKNNILKQTPIAEGGEGVIYNLGNKILKVYKDNVDKKEKLAKIDVLLKKSLPKNIVAPLDKAYDEKKRFIGYIMEKVEGEELKRLSNKKFVQINNIQIKEIAKMMMQIKDTLIELHKENIIISDFNENNILFDKNFNVFFIDVDSWTVENIFCTVCMETFKDPLLDLNYFSTETDYYSFCVLFFKSFTRLHPFGGVMNPDINILERMEKGISVIDNQKVIIPKTVNRWSFFPTKLIEEMKNIFEKKERFLLNIDDFCKNLKLCPTHNDYYYSKYTKCPVCESGAVVIEVPVKAASSGAIPFIILLDDKDIKVVLAQNTYLSKDNYVVNKETRKKVKYKQGSKYYLSDDGSILYTISDQKIQIKANGKPFEIDKINKSYVSVKNNRIYFINENCCLTEVTVGKIGKFFNSVTKVSFNCIFEVEDMNNYFVCNIYDNMKIINVSGSNYILQDKTKIVNYGIHFDAATNRWLFITEDDKGNFKTMVFDGNKVIYENDSIKYITDLNNMCFSNKIIFRPGDKFIKGFDYKNNVYKDFPCDVVNESSKLIRDKSKFIVINEKAVYQVG